MDKIRHGTGMFNSSTGVLARRFKTMATLALLAAMSVVAPGVHAAGSCDASTREDALALVRETTDALFAAVDAYDGSLREDPAHARALVDEFITPHVDLKGFSKLVLGKHWRRATREQQKRFLAQFRTLVLRTYATAVTSYTGIRIEYMPMREESRENFATVRTLIPRPAGEGVKVNYRLHCRKNIWKLFDVSIAGVSMVTTYRSAFSAEVKRSGVEGLIKALEQKNGEIGA
jgi:phospholipid transport system substrate-binding protein